MAFENTISEHDLDPDTQQFVRNVRGDHEDREPDLTVDGLSESILSRILGLFGRSRARR